MSVMGDSRWYKKLKKPNDPIDQTDAAYIDALLDSYAFGNAFKYGPSTTLIGDGPLGSDYDYAALRRAWNELNSTDKQSIVDQFIKEGTFGIEYIDTEALLNQIDDLPEMLAEYNALEAPKYETYRMPLLKDYLEEAEQEIAQQNAEKYANLDELLALSKETYGSQLANISESYDYARDKLLAGQQLKNAQLMDSLQSGMERSRRNALEAGASAGIRIADNINTLLSVQNKQAYTSMETANQLAQMMINQRNAEAGVRSNYLNAVSTDKLERNRIIDSTTERTNALADQKYKPAYKEYESNKQYQQDYNDNYYARADEYNNKYSKTNAAHPYFTK